MNIKKIVIASLVSVSLSACFKLDQYPHDTFAVDRSFQTIDDAEYWTNGVYQLLRESTYGDFMTIPEMQTDLLDVTIGKQLSVNFRSAYTWHEFSPSDVFVQKIWERYYSNLKNVNQSIEGFEKISPKNPQEAQDLNAYKGAVYLARALYYSRLATLYCKPYNEATADTDLGLPLVLFVSPENVPARSSLKETYNQMLSDIAKAEFYLKDTPNKLGADYFTYDAALLLKARVLLYQQKWAEAYQAASELVNSGRYPLVTNQERFKQVWYEDAVDETITQLFVSSTEAIDDGGKNMLYIGYVKTPSYEVYDPVLLPNQWVIDLYNENDIRKETYFQSRPIYKPSGEQKEVSLVYKYPGNPEIFVGKSSKNEHKPKIFRIAEAYLIAAEAAYMNNDSANAEKYLNKLKQARNSSPIAKDLLEEIREERLRELAFEGFRLMDLKRWDLGVDRSNKAPQDIEYIITDPAEQYHQLQKDPKDYRMVWPIPSIEIEAIGKEKLKQNPNW